MRIIQLCIIAIGLIFFLPTTTIRASVCFQMEVQTKNQEINNIKETKEVMEIILREQFSTSEEDRSRILPPMPETKDPCLPTKGNSRIEYISSENITKDMLPQIPCVKLVMLTPKEISAKSEKGIEYIIFDKIERADDKVFITFTFWHRSLGFTASNGATYTFYKKDGQWQRNEEIGIHSSIT